MEAYVKSYSAYRTIKRARVISSALTLDSLDCEASTVTVIGTDIGRGNTGDWLVIDGEVYQIATVKPEKDRTILTLMPPLEAFSRSLEYLLQSTAQTAGGFISAALVSNWINCVDPVYAMGYLSVSDSDTTAFVSPELDSDGCFNLVEYCRLMRKSYRVVVRFSDAGNKLRCTISKAPAAAHQVSFEDGHSQLQSVNYSASGTAKITVLHDIDTGEKDENGESIITRERTDWYLADDGTISQDVPARRASGAWSTITVTGNADVEAKVVETFAKNKANHKLEFWSTRDLSVHDDCTFYVYGELLQSYISYKRKSSNDKRFYYKSGELATTATEKLRGVKK